MSSQLAKAVYDIALLQFSLRLLAMREDKVRDSDRLDAVIAAFDDFVQHAAIPLFMTLGVEKKDWIEALKHAKKIYNAKRAG